MPINEFAPLRGMQHAQSPATRKRKQKQQDAQLLHLREQREREDEILQEWGYAPWKREDRRNRPLRTKTAGVSFNARMREAEVVRLRCVHGLSFRQIGERLGISHVAAWKRYQWFMESRRLEEAYRAKCLREIQWKMDEMERLMPRLSHLSPEERNCIHVSLGLVPGE